MRFSAKLALAILLLCSLFVTQTSLAQKSPSSKDDPVYVDQQGVLRWKKNNKEANFFGVNYTVPFAYGYRSHQALGLDLEKAIDQDVYHLARMGIDAFRVHVWDTEISDSVGNLLENEHLRLFDYLLAKLKERNIKILVTPIAFWGPGYPEPDEPTAGFSSIYNKQQAVTNEKAIQAQERYLEQFFRHVNPYTGLTYQDDPDIIAAEINNEPKHSGPKSRATEYVNRTVAAVRGTGWTKPIFYNISESPTYADAVAKANIQGVSFQWYPTGLVANHTLEGNYLPHVDEYRIPFDTIPAFAGKARMVYEFDAGDILQPIMYPAMARSFRGAGFQWATQFAYDPLATAYANTEYQTHYLNLAYTPAKAVSLMIASEAFHQLPRGKNYGTYPLDTVFNVFRVSYDQQLSEMNAPQKFYYANNTTSRPVSPSKLEHIAGVGSSPVVQYAGTGAYFIDKLDNGVWRLEVMPDAIHVRDPFGKASPQRLVTRIAWEEHPMAVQLPGLGESFTVKGLNQGNTYSTKARGGRFQIQPGTYLLSKKENPKIRKEQVGAVKLREYVAPEPLTKEPYVSHESRNEVTAGQPFTVNAKIVGIDTAAQVSLVANNLSGVWKTVPMERIAPFKYRATAPADLVTPGLIKYRIVVQTSQGEFFTFPGAHQGNPWAWDYVQGDDTWQTFVAPENGALEIFNATTDQDIYVYPNLWRSDERRLITGERPGQLILRLAAKELNGSDVMGWQYYFGDKVKGRASELQGFDKLVIRARTTNAESVQAKVTLITDDASGYAANVTLDNTLREIEVPLSSLKPSSFMLLPRPYPGFHPFWFKPGAVEPFEVGQAEKFEITVGEGVPATEKGKPYTLEVESVWLEKSK
ncbi:hypothetical protein CLV24_11675 [Pontibacter ummariensis]|uniref:Cellulase (Glycosyl hydrolase family 5) n=1 Tax=Pontibacter ummariensis TaxID=1610492 RepID=A0A239I8R8_9BACT|nr:membrane or secreted protein [Pontibacter ummariensis]PRY10007.1 hypothetical protein CLV24_11675 [Pontibacter ummariensis]SNS89453.1 hypothetical protein SAMN06296052_11624 [Pontibacter ummariensis]